ncbi:hypothetical protein A2165_03440 [Candidatus Curtissbacteria bacterium RBG_13_40_7]|uniref:Methylated-DNA-[protein]-cysteine S-methyltransferase DNA binding domain-containing protein n=1 Tax=Candidatus Curtissbacteria bacterium RBG_13_40_7 TaxID=1797706 RepID=A0A1F5FZ33_9BACT|nr:MAG: hypothetical protein A2165_03440 [Candidatus Curtissbacteria bacterium RBG_13_40_7]
MILRDETYDLVRKIPRGKVVTYGQLANKLKIDPRMVGWVLHANHTREVPCHRVVNRNGRIAPNFGLGGWQEQKKRLELENVEFSDMMHVNLDKFRWQF